MATKRQSVGTWAKKAAKAVLVVKREDMPPLPWLDTITNAIERASTLSECTLQTLLAVQFLAAEPGYWARVTGRDPMAILHKRLAELLALATALRAELRHDNARVADAYVSQRDPMRVGGNAYPSAHVAVLELATAAIWGRHVPSDLALDELRASYSVCVKSIGLVLVGMAAQELSTALRYEHEHAKGKALGNASKRAAASEHAADWASLPGHLQDLLMKVMSKVAAGTAFSVGEVLSNGEDKRRPKRYLENLVKLGVLKRGPKGQRSPYRWTRKPEGMPERRPQKPP